MNSFTKFFTATNEYGYSYFLITCCVLLTIVLLVGLIYYISYKIN